MARLINFKTVNQNWQAGLTKVDRKKVYGYISEEVTDLDGNLCTMGNILDDGSTLILPGLTAMKTVDLDNAEIDKKSLKAVYMDGSDAEIIPSSFDIDIELTETKVDDLFNLEITSIYQLDFENDDQKKELQEELINGKVYGFVFNFRAGYDASDAILLANNEGVFALIGRLIEFDYLDNNIVDFVIDDDEDEEDEMDFSML